MKIALIQFREVGKKYYFSINDELNLNIGDTVVVETSVGIETGTIYLLKDEEEVNVIKTLKPILRVATKDDLLSKTNNEEHEQLIVQSTVKMVKELELNMKILDAEYTLDKEKLTIYFEADERVDFRELVKRLSSSYQTRIELRQIGPRDVAKRVGGIGPCGQVLCCSTFIGDFEPVTIKMAKNQNLTLNPKKISGICGKLLCCLKYEDEVYSHLRDVLPDRFEKVQTEHGKGTVMDINFISSKIKIKYYDDELAPEWVHLDNLIGRS